MNVKLEFVMELPRGLMDAMKLNDETLLCSWIDCGDLHIRVEDDPSGFNDDTPCAEDDTPCIENDTQDEDEDEDAYEYGYDEGYDEGYDVGCEEGFSMGHAAGLDEGLTEGYERGVRDALALRFRRSASRDEEWRN